MCYGFRPRMVARHLPKTEAKRARIWMTAAWGLSLRLAAQNSSAFNSLSQYFPVCGCVRAQCMQRACSRRMLWQFEHETHTTQSAVSVEPVSAHHRNVASGYHQYGQQLFMKRLQHTAEFFSEPSWEITDWLKYFFPDFYSEVQRQVRSNSHFLYLSKCRCSKRGMHQY